MRSRTERDLRELERHFGVSQESSGTFQWQPTSCPNEAARQYRDLVNAGQHRSATGIANVSAAEAEANYRRLMA